MVNLVGDLYETDHLADEAVSDNISARLNINRIEEGFENEWHLC